MPARVRLRRRSEGCGRAPSPGVRRSTACRTESGVTLCCTPMLLLQNYIRIPLDIVALLMQVGKCRPSGFLEHGVLKRWTDHRVNARPQLSQSACHEVCLTSDASLTSERASILSDLVQTRDVVSLVWYLRLCYHPVRSSCRTRNGIPNGGVTSCFIGKLDMHLY